MKVKYLLALALSHHAELLILDEPTSGLDPVSREELLHIFRQIVKNENCSILFSTHITSDLDKCADDITYIQNGRVLKSADKDTFLRSFEHLKAQKSAGMCPCPHFSAFKNARGYGAAHSGRNHAADGKE